MCLAGIELFNLYDCIAHAYVYISAYLSMLVWTNHDDWTSAKPWKRAWRATARLQGRREADWERRLFKLNALAVHMATYFWTMVTSLMIMWQCEWQPDSRLYGWLQVHSWHDCSYIAWIPLLAHGLTVKLSPCPLQFVTSLLRLAPGWFSILLVMLVGWWWHFIPHLSTQDTLHKVFHQTWSKGSRVKTKPGHEQAT